MSLSYAQEKLGDAIDTLDRWPLPRSLASAGLLLVRLEPNDFPQDLRVEYARLIETITAGGSIESTVDAMSVDRINEVVRWIKELAHAVDRRCECGRDP